jgi:hypothetical protein
MGIPTWAVGQVLTASDVNTWFVPAAAYKTTDQTSTSSALANDNELFLAAAANAAYRFECWLTWIGVTAANIQWTWTVPAGAGIVYEPLHNEGGGVGLGNACNSYADSDTVSAAGASPTVTAVLMKGHLITVGTSGTVRLKWSQAAANASATHVRPQSYLQLDRIG